MKCAYCDRNDAKIIRFPFANRWWRYKDPTCVECGKVAMAGIVLNLELAGVVIENDLPTGIPEEDDDE